MTASNGIEVLGLVREFKNGPRAVDGIDLEVAPGEIYGFLGPNGAGKSTTVLMLTTLLPPTAGTARVAGHDIVREGAGGAGRDRRRAAGGGARPAADRRATTCACRRRSRACRRRSGAPRGDELIERVGLADAADRKVGGYSGGMKRRLDLALALVHRPRLLFLDEPTTGLGPVEPRRHVEEVARLARDEGVTVFLTTQYLEEADVLADRVGIIDHGRIVAEGTPEALKAEIGRPSVEAVPAERDERDGRRRRCSRASARRSPRRRAPPRVRLESRRGPRRRRARARRRRTSAWPTCSSTSRRSTTSSSPRPGRKLDADDEQPAPRRRTSRREPAAGRAPRWRGARCCRRCASRRW